MGMQYHLSINFTRVLSSCFSLLLPGFFLWGPRGDKDIRAEAFLVCLSQKEKTVVKKMLQPIM